MSPTALQAMPSSFAAGTTVKYTRSYQEYPASDGWVLKLHLKGALARDYTADVNADGKSFDFTLPAIGADVGTDLLVPVASRSALYQWEERVEKASPADGPYLLARGAVTVSMNLASAAAGAAEDQDEKELRILNALIEGRLTTDMESYEIEGQAAVRIKSEAAYKLREKTLRRIAAKRHPGRFATPVRMEFTPPR